MHCNHLPSLGLCKVFELGIARANKVELLCAPPAFELFFPGDGCANIFVVLKVEQSLATIGLSETVPCTLLMLQDTEIQVAGDADVKRACMAAENVDLGAGHGKMLASSWFSAPEKKPWRASVVEKLRTAWVRLAPPRSFDSAPQALVYAINLCGAPLRMTILWEY
jgi:hypothetical protein